MIATIDIEIEPRTSYRLSARLRVVGAVGRLAPVLLTCRFSDIHGTVMKEAPAGFAHSGTYGAHVHLGHAEGTVTATRDVDVIQSITPPAGAVSATLTLHRWRAGNVSLLTPLKAAAIRPPAVDPVTEVGHPLGEDRLLWSYKGPATSGEVYELTATFNRPLADRDIVAAIRFTDANGQELAPGGQIAKSDQVGYFQYLTASKGAPLAPAQSPAEYRAEGYARFHAPSNVVNIDARLFRWGKDTSLSLDDVDFTPRSSRADLMASGLLACHNDHTLNGPALTFMAKLCVTGPEPILVDLAFIDDDGQILTATTQGLQRNVQFDTFMALSADALSRFDGQLPLHIALRPPKGALAIRWSLFMPQGGTHSLIEQPRLSDSAERSEADPEARPDQALYDALTQVTGTPQYQTYAALNGFDTLASAAVALDQSAPIGEGNWQTMTIDLTRHAGGLDHATIVLCATYFDTDKVPLVGVKTAGFATTTGIGMHRSLVVVSQDAPGRNARISTPLLAPDGAAYGLFDVIVCRADSAIEASPITLVSIGVAKACRTLDPVLMAKPQLIQALDIAQAAQDTAAQHAILSALATVDPKTKGYAYRTRILAETIEIQTLGWMPDLGSVFAVKLSDQNLNCIFHSADTAPDMHRLLIQRQADHGLRPVLGTGFDAFDGRPAPAGVSVAPFAFPVVGAEGLSRADRLSIEARQHSAAITTHSVSLVHITTDFETADRALVGMALARAHDLPLVVELSNLASARADPVLINHCLTAADHIIVSTQADGAAPCIAEISPDRIVVIDPALDPKFEMPAPRAALKVLQASHGLNLHKAVGYHSTQGADITETMAVLTALPAQSVVVLFGAGGFLLATQLRGAGMQAIHADESDNTIGDIRAWYRLCEVVIIGAGEQPSVVIQAALRGLSQGCKVVVPDSLDARHLAGPDGTRTHLFDPSDPETLTAALATASASPRLQQVSTQRWLREKRLWSHRITGYVATYGAARSWHQQHDRGV
jgi:hypothetical protein